MIKICEVCQKESITDKHHIHSKSLGGSNKLNNLAFLCPNCHKLVHKGLIVLEGKFDTTDGKILVYHKFNEESITNEEPPVYLELDYKHWQELYLMKK